MAIQKLLVRAAHTALVPDYEAQEDGILRYVGRHRDATIGDGGAWVPDVDPRELPVRAEYLQELRAGCLLPADEDTARLCGVPFVKEPKTTKGVTDAR